MIAKVRSRETCDPLCIIIYACCDESPELVSESQWGSRAAYCNCIFREEWMKLLIFRIRLDEIHFPQLFSKLYYVSNSENGEEVDSSGSPVSTEKEYLLNLLPNISSDPLTLFHGAKLDLLLDRSAMVDLLGYSHGLVDFVDTLLSSGLLELPLGFLHNLETPAIIRNAMKQADNPETTTTICTPEFCPNEGSRRDGFCRESVLLTKTTHI